jgi:hypothetical protein
MNQYIKKNPRVFVIKRLRRVQEQSFMEETLSTRGWMTATNEAVAFATVKQAMHHIDKAIPNNTGLWVEGPKGGKYFYKKGGYQSCEA